MLDVVAALIPHILHLAAEADLFGLVHFGDEPGVAQAQPVVGQLHLLAVHDLLLEDAQLIADGIAGGGDLQGRHRVQVAGGQAAKAAVAQTRVGLGLEQVGGGEAQSLDGCRQGRQQPQVIGVFHQGAAHQKFQGEVVHLAQMLGGYPVLGRQLPLVDDVPQHQGAGLEHMQAGGLFHIPAEIAAQLAGDEVHQFFLAVRMQCRHLLNN